ncbi:MAG: response regulator [Patulibacter minatonensis]
MPERPLIGLVEDNDLDFHAYRRTFGPVSELRRWESGEALIASLLSEDGLLEQLDLLILDLNLPGIDGVHLAHTVRIAPGGADLPIVVLTGSQAEPDILRALEADVTEYEVKPNTAAELRALVQRTLAVIAPRESRPA